MPAATPIPGPPRYGPNFVILWYTLCGGGGGGGRRPGGGEFHISLAHTPTTENWDHTEAAPESGWPQTYDRWQTDPHPPRHGPFKRKGVCPPMGPSGPYAGLGRGVPLSPKAQRALVSLSRVQYTRAPHSTMPVPHPLGRGSPGGLNRATPIGGWAGGGGIGAIGQRSRIRNRPGSSFKATGSPLFPTSPPDCFP